ncbi:unnamed protein product [Rotaria sp. Silwood1]|nr:unnamed protein product [Rotaria sp. Silwood1]
MKISSIFLIIIIIFIFINSINNFELPKEIRIGAIFDTYDTLSRQAFEYAVAKINAQTHIFKNSKIIINHINMVDAYDSYSAYRMGNKIENKISKKND